jgi:hypothetical protein
MSGLIYVLSKVLLNSPGIFFIYLKILITQELHGSHIGGAQSL